MWSVQRIFLNKIINKEYSDRDLRKKMRGSDRCF